MIGMRLSSSSLNLFFIAHCQLYRVNNDRVSLQLEYQPPPTNNIKI